MAPDAQMTLTLEPGEWSGHADRWLALALASATLDNLRRQVEEGARLFYIRSNGITVGAFVLRVDKVDDGNEGVIVAAAGELAGCDITESCLPAIEAMFVGCRRVRIHTRNAALVRKLSRFGYLPREVIATKEIRCAA